jgi:protein O-GlcNAc transferase
MKKIISFSLWGNDPFYIEGAYKNIELAKEIYPDWICRFYVAKKNTPEEVIQKLESFQNAEVVIMDEEGTSNSMMWRFTPCDDDDVELFISRDTDSRLSVREKEAVDQWLESDKNFHVMRDHPYHFTAIMGGMWGMKKEAKINMRNKIQNFIRGGYHEDKKGADQAFLWGLIWPLAIEDNVTHDPFFTDNAPFPTVDRDPAALVYYVGECVRADDSLWSQADRDAVDEAENGN